jgi:O-antigen ligase
VLWGYGLVALLIAAFINTSIRISRTLNTYRRFLLWYLPVLPGLVYASVALRDYLPVIPWSDQSTILMVKAGDAGVHLCGAALFALLFVRREAQGWRRQVSLPGILAFIGWSAASLIVLIVSRGGFAAMIIPILLVSMWMPRKVGWKVAVAGVCTSTLILLILSSNLVTIHVKGRDFSAGDVIDMVTNTAGGSDTAAGHEGTIEWRLAWWTKIVDDTIYGPHFWTGQGFGVNLAAINDPTSLSDDDTGLRSPHNVTMTVLARMGVPGLVLWLALNGVFAFRMISCHLAANRRREEFWSRLYLWILCYWLAALINATFDVYLEGPQGGILFWSLTGLGIAAMRIHDFERRSEEAPAAAILDPEPRMPNLLDARGYPASP